MIRTSIIAAIGKNRELGAKNTLLWHIPEDMKHFRDLTRGKPVIMGSNTLRSIGRVLPGRPNIVLTNNPTAAAREFAEYSVATHDTPGTSLVFVPSLEQAYKKAKTLARKTHVDEVFNIGGASLYAQGLHDADRLYLTRVDAAFPKADVFFPEYAEVFRHVIEESRSGDEQYEYTFVTLKK